MKNIAIIGAGISGLVLGNFFKSKSINFKIFEKKSEINFNEGYGIQLGINSIQILNKIGFKSFNKDNLYNPKKIIIKSLQNQSRISQIDLDYFNNLSEKYTCLKRSILVKFLFNKIREKIHLNKSVADFEHLDNKIKINFYDQTSEEFDYVVLASGFEPDISKLLFKNYHKNTYAGYLAIRKIFTEKLNFIEEENITLFFGKNSHLVTYPIDNNKSKNAVFIVKQNLDSNNLYSSWRRSADGLKFIDKLLKDNLYVNSQEFSYIFKKNSSWWPVIINKNFLEPKYKNVFAIGDAIHSNLPTLAQGAGQAIESAYELSNILDKESDTESIKYFLNRKKRLNIIDRRIYLNNFIFHISNPFLIFFRNIIIKFFLKKKIFLNNYLGKIYKN